MVTLFDYLIKSAFSITILYMVFHLFFRNRVSFMFNRVLLISIVLFGLIVPMLSFNINSVLNFSSPYASTIINSEGLITVNLKEIVINSETQYKLFGMSFIKIIALVYLLISLVLGLWFVLKVVRLFMLTRKNETRTIDGFKFVFLNDNYPTFSFFNIVFIHKQLFDSKVESEKIIEHEGVHSVQRHSIDLLFAELLIIIQWFNPIVYFIRKSIKENHEFLADKGILKNDFDIPDYKLLLLRNSTTIRTGSITHNFSYSLIKKRFKMMEKKDSKIKFILAMMILPIAFSLAFFACSSPEIEEDMPVVITEEPAKEPTEEKVVMPMPYEQPQTVPEAEIFAVVEEMPTFPGGVEELYKYLGANIKYPEQAKDDNIQGRVFVNFVVEKDGEITNVKILRGIGGGCDEEAIRVVSSMPKWKPGTQRGKNVRVAYNLPIKYSLK